MVLSSYDFTYPLNPFATFFGLVELRSFFFASVALTVLLILAYLTNPNEASFRSFLTELAFRRHLTKLNDRGDHSQERHPNQPSSGLHYASSPPRDGTQDNQIHPNPTSLVGGLAAPSSGANPIATSLNFSNRAAVSLRTPGHFFRSFGIFTIAIVTPLTDTPSAQALRRRQSRLSPSVSSHNTNVNSSSHNSTTPRWTPGPTLASQASVIDGSWFIGAFGKWWVGGSVEVPSKDAHLLSKEEGAPPGILSMRSLIVSGPSNTQPASSTKPSPARSTTKLQKRKSVQSKPTSNGVPSEGSVPYPARSTTPPPLPKSATLPLHTVRLPPSKDSVQSRSANCPIVNGAPSTPSLPQVTSHTGSVPTAGVSSPSQPFPVAEPQSTLSVSSQSNPSHSHSRSRTLSSHLASIDANPLIADLLSQVHTSQAAVAETRLQLQSFQATSQSSTSALQTSLESHRSLKRAADQTKLDLKLRLKSLEDSKRNAEGVKREADKKLKGALSVKEQTEGKINKLNVESEKLHQKVADDEAKQIKSGLDASAAEAEMKRTLENKKKELKAAEELVASLGQRARDLEEKFKEEKARLVKVKEEAVLRRRERVERNLKESSTSSLALNIIPQPPAQPPRQAPVLPAKSTPVTILSKPDTSPPNVAPAPPIAPKTILQRRVSVSRAPAPNNGVAAQIPQQQQQQKTPSPLTLLQRRNVPEPEPLTIVPASSSHTLAAQDQRRVRALSLGGNQGVAVVNMNMNLNGGTTSDFNANTYASRNVNAATPPSGLGTSITEDEDDNLQPPAIGPAPGAHTEKAITTPSAALPTVPVLGLPNIGMTSVPTPPPTFDFSPFSDSDSDIGDSTGISGGHSKQSSLGLGLGVPNDPSVDAGPLSPFASSLLPKSLFKSLDAESSPRPSIDGNLDMDVNFHRLGAGGSSGTDFEDGAEDLGLYGGSVNSRFFGHAHTVHQSPPSTTTQERRSRGNSLSMSPYVSTAGPFAPMKHELVDTMDMGGHSLAHAESWPTSFHQPRQTYPQTHGYGNANGGDHLLHSSPELAIHTSAGTTSPSSINSATAHSNGGNFGLGRSLWSSPATDESPISMFDSYMGPPLLRSLSREQETVEQMHESDKGNNKGRIGGHLKWFSSGSSNGKDTGFGGVTAHAASLSEGSTKKKEKGLNPDAKVFSFNRGRSILLNSVAALNGNGTAVIGDPSAFSSTSTSLAPALPSPNPSLASRIYGSLSQTLQPHRSQVDHSDSYGLDSGATMSSGGNFFSSLKAFAPSPAERQALQRALGNTASGGSGLNKSHEQLTTSPFTSTIGNNQTDRTGAMAWDGDAYQSNEQVASQPRNAKRGFTSLWSKGTKPPVLVETVEPPYHLANGVADETTWQMHGGFGGGVASDEYN